MGMLQISKQLLESEQIKGVNGGEFYQSMIAKELAVLEKLDITFCDMAGTLEDVEKRLDGCEVLIMPKGTYGEMVKAVYFKDCVKKHLEDIE